MSALHVISAAHCTVRETPDSMEVILGKHWSDAKGTRASNECSQRSHSSSMGLESIKGNFPHSKVELVQALSTR